MYTDTGELAAAAYTWGVAHPTGYPLLTMLGHVWSMLPWHTVIGGLNILAALFTAGGVAITTMIVQRLLPRASSQPWIPMATSMLFGFCTLIWSQSTAYEVYSLNLLLITATLYATVRARQDNTVQWSLMAGLLFGLALSNHLSSVFLAPGLLVLWWHRNRTRQEWLTLLLPVIIGLSLYILLPLRSAALPPINWGWVHRGWESFIYHVKGTQFGVWMFTDSKALSTNFGIFFSEASRMLLWVGWIPVVVGLADLFKRERRLTIGLLTILAGNLVISLGYAIPDISAYFIPSALVLMVFVGVGIWRLLASASSPLQQSALLLPVVALVLNLQTMNHRNDHAVEAYTQWAWSNLEPNAIVLSRQWDYLLSAMWYEQTVEHKRADVAIIDKELLRRTWYIPYLTQLYPTVMNGARVAAQDFLPWLHTFESDADQFNAVRSNGAEIQRRFVTFLNAVVDSNSTRPIYVTPEILNEEQGFAQGYAAIPVGPFYRLTRDTTLRTKCAVDGLDLLATSLEHRNSRLDSGLRLTALGMVSTNVVYSFQVLADTSFARSLRNHAVALDSKSRTTRMLLQRIP